MRKPLLSDAFASNPTLPYKSPFVKEIAGKLATRPMETEIFADNMCHQISPASCISASANFSACFLTSLQIMLDKD